EFLVVKPPPFCYVGDRVEREGVLREARDEPLDKRGRLPRISRTYGMTDSKATVTLWPEVAKCNGCLAVSTRPGGAEVGGMKLQCDDALRRRYGFDDKRF